MVINCQKWISLKMICSTHLPLETNSSDANKQRQDKILKLIYFFFKILNFTLRFLSFPLLFVSLGPPPPTIFSLLAGHSLGLISAQSLASKLGITFV